MNYTIKLGDSQNLLKELESNSIDLTVTSPPYDNIRFYENSLEWNFKIFTRIAKELFRVTKEGGVLVWIVNDSVINGSESGTSFRQALFFKKFFLLHDTMIWNKKVFSMPYKNRYHQVFEYMFVFCKGYLKTFNPIIDRKNIYKKSFGINSKRYPNGEMIITKERDVSQEFGKRFNVWEIPTVAQENICKALEHPAMFSERLANDHIISFSNQNDTILDPFIGSGTTGRMAIRNNRNFIGFEKVEKYFQLSKTNLEKEIENKEMFSKNFIDLKNEEKDWF